MDKFIAAGSSGGRVVSPAGWLGLGKRWAPGRGLQCSWCGRVARARGTILWVCLDMQSVRVPLLGVEGPDSRGGGLWWPSWTPPEAFLYV